MTVVYMNATQTEGLLGMIAVIAILGLLVLPAVIGIAHDRMIDRQIRRSQREEATRTKEAKEKKETGRPSRPRRHHGAAHPVRTAGQKSSSRSTVPSTATWYADGRRSKKFVSS